MEIPAHSKKYKIPEFTRTLILCCKGIQSAAKFWRESDVGEIRKIVSLEQDVLNAPFHYSGNHDKCAAFFCKKHTGSPANDLVDLMKADGLWMEIMNQMQFYFGNHAKSLIANCTTNVAEQFNSIIAKNIAGKRINFSLASSYKARVSAAVVQHNSRGKAGSSYYEYKQLESNRLIKILERKRKLKTEENNGDGETRRKIR